MLVNMMFGELAQHSKPSLDDLWQAANFIPNEQQREAIKYVDGPLFLKAGPGSGKTKVLLWRTLHLIVHHDARPEEIFLATFTEKAALQLKEGLRALMEYATKVTKQTVDLSNMYVGTIHSLCQRIIKDRRFSPSRQRPKSPLLLDELGQYLFLYNARRWKELISAVGWENANNEINEYLSGWPSVSRHRAVSSCLSLFNRFSEECIKPERVRIRAIAPELRELICLYKEYRRALLEEKPPQTDFALLQQAALDALEELDRRSGRILSGAIFKHVIIDEYQDTNTIQEKLIFKLSAGHKNICVVGDDDQALYRFRGATVENFVEFPKRCERYLGKTPKEIPLVTNYRSRNKILEFYSDFITHNSCDWSKGPRTKESYRIAKSLVADRKDHKTSVVMSKPDNPTAVCNEIAQLVKKIIDLKKVDDPNQIAFLFPSLKSNNVQRMIEALESRGLKVYAPRAKTFLDVKEATAMIGLFLQIFGKPSRQDHWGNDYKKYMDWLDRSSEIGERLLNSDSSLNRYVEARRNEINTVLGDYQILKQTMERNGWSGEETYNPSTMGNAIKNANGLSRAAKRTISSRYLGELIQRRMESGRPFSLGYVVRRATSFDWNALDLFYRFCGFGHFRKMFDKALSVKKDEGPICNLSLLSNYLSRYLDYQSISIFDARLLSNDGFKKSFFLGYLYALYRRGESEYEDAQDPFPRGRIPFLTIHQAKGLEFPVVILGSARKNNRKPQRIEEVVQPLIKNKCEPLDKMPIFDVMRMFYVALSRAKNLLVIAYYRGAGQTINEPFKSMLDESFPRINQLNVGSVPRDEIKSDDLPRSYSYTGDYLLYKRCPSQYMIFRKYGFAPARSLTMFFGSLVHETIDDLHQHLLDKRHAHEQ
jgi:DNA helicase-2/ATP-dependent DNA helicase PcrA